MQAYNHTLWMAYAIAEYSVPHRVWHVEQYLARGGSEALSATPADRLDPLTLQVKAKQVTEWKPDAGRLGTGMAYYR